VVLAYVPGGMTACANAHSSTKNIRRRFQRLMPQTKQHDRPHSKRAQGNCETSGVTFQGLVLNGRALFVGPEGCGSAPVEPLEDVPVASAPRVAEGHWRPQVRLASWAHQRAS